MRKILPNTHFNRKRDRLSAALIMAAAMTFIVGTISGYALKESSEQTVVSEAMVQFTEASDADSSAAASALENTVVSSASAAETVNTVSDTVNGSGTRVIRGAVNTSSDASETTASGSAGAAASDAASNSNRTPEYTPVSTVKTDASSYFGNGGSLTMLANHDSNAQNMSFIMETGDGGLIVVDGGWDVNGEYLLSEIRKRGSHVEAWLITHPHRDHAMALAWILNNHPGDITIDGIYYSFFNRDWYMNYDFESVEVYDALMSGFSNIEQSKLHGDIAAGQTIKAGNALIQVLNDPYKLTSNSGNNSSVAYMVSLNGTNVVFLGDMGLAAGNLMMQDVDLASLKCDMVQVAHHGQEAVSFSFYQQLAPRVMLWPTPRWLWDNDNGGGKGSGNYHTDTTRRWQSGLLIKEYYVAMDEDQTIR